MKHEILNQDVMLDLSRFPVVHPTMILKEVLEAMTRHAFGIACVVDGAGKLVGIFTDGDMRRLTLRQQKPWSALFVDDIMTHANASPRTVPPAGMLVDSIRLMEEKHIWDLPVVGADGKLVGLLHLHQAIKHLLGI
jgi:arabinose-5-phosphate isomerase